MRAIAAAALWIILGGCALSGAYPPPAPATPATYVVRPRDTLYSIAWRHDVDYRDLAKWNHLGADYRIVIGQVLVLQPNANPKSSSPASAAQPLPAQPLSALPLTALPPPPPAAQTPAAQAPRVQSAAPGRDLPGGGVPKWVWPTDAETAPRPVPGGGILLLGRLGQDIRAAGAGRVVYTGSGLRGYGNLVIIKHGERLLSSYAHNRELLVHEGQNVAAGQIIAHMGMGPHQVSALYFEIRIDGKPTDPLPYLAAAK